MHILLRFFAIIIALTFFSEIIVRLVLNFPANSIPDDELGWVYKPNSTILFTSEGHAVNKLNSSGFNDDEPDSDDNKTQILVLGDSITEALQVQKSENFTSITETLAPCFNIYNTGRSGLSPIHYPIVFSRAAKLVAPSLAVIVVTSGDLNDIRHGNYTITKDKTGKNIKDLNLNEKPLSALRIKLNPIISRSALVTYLIQRAKAILINKRLDNAETDKTKTIISDSEIERIQQILVYLIARIDAETPVAILYIPYMNYDVNRVATENKQSDDFKRLLSNAADIVGVPVLSTESHMIASYLKHGQPGAGFANKNILHGHLNRLGHQATALAMLELIEKAGPQCSPMNNSPEH